MSSNKLIPGVAVAVAAVVGVASGCGTVNNSPDAAPGDTQAPSDMQVPADGPLRPVICGTQPIEVLPNGGFDDASPLWTQDPSTPVLLCSMTITPDKGPKAACLGGLDGSVLTLSQQVQLPLGAKQLTLTGRRCITTQETAAADNDVLTFDLVDGSATVATLGRLSNQQGVPKDCGFSTFTLGPVPTTDPVTATLRISSTLDSARTTSFFIDTLSLKVSCQ